MPFFGMMDEGMSTGNQYTWSQTDGEVEVVLQIPHQWKLDELVINLQPTTLSITHTPSGETVLDGELFGKVMKDDSTWQLEPGELTMMLEKVDDSKKQDRWPCVIAGHPEIDLNARAHRPTRKGEKKDV